MSGNRGVGCCSHVACCLLGARLTREEIASLKYRRGRDVITKENYGRFDDPSSSLNEEIPNQEEQQNGSNNIQDESFLNEEVGNDDQDENYHDIFDVPEDSHNYDIGSGELHGQFNFYNGFPNKIFR